MSVQLGLRRNWKQFTLLILINAFVGGMMGLERTIIPEIAEVEFGLAARTAILSFITVFGLTKAFTNDYAGALANRFGRKNLLIAGWVLVPLFKGANRDIADSFPASHSYPKVKFIRLP